MPTRSDEIATARRVAELEAEYQAALADDDMMQALAALQKQAVALNLYPPGVAPDIVTAAGPGDPGRSS